ncbi:MAG: HD domain-containing protein [Oligoflexia bacterium]|nr:HD domain-containing protein [Oligoflexia bacterium]
MKSKNKEESDFNFFSIHMDFVKTEIISLYDIYINSSIIPGRERFVRIYPKGEYLKKSTLRELQSKYFQLYLSEDQRTDYLKSLVGNREVTDEEKSKVIKDSAIKYLSTLFNNKHEFKTELLSETIRNCRDVVESIVDVIKDYSINDLYELVGKLSFHDFYTYDHSINVAMYCIAIYRVLYKDAPKETIVSLGLGGLLHDLGKLKLSTSILNNPGKLTKEEFDEIKKHPGFGLQMLLEVKESWKSGKIERCEGVDIDLTAKIIHEHHENFDGTGYPRQTVGNEISIEARITAIADFFDAITTKRAYHEILSIEQAVDVMSRSVGKKIDPQVFKVFLSNLKKISLSARTKFKIADDFDPSSPHEKLPLEEVQEEKKVENFGKIIFKDDSNSD